MACAPALVETVSLGSAVVAESLRLQREGLQKGLEIRPKSVTTPIIGLGLAPCAAEAVMPTSKVLPLQESVGGSAEENDEASGLMGKQPIQPMAITFSTAIVIKISGDMLEQAASLPVVGFERCSTTCAVLPEKGEVGFLSATCQTPPEQASPLAEEASAVSGLRAANSPVAAQKGT